MFTWADQAGLEQTLDLQDSNCNHKSGILRHDYAQITTKHLLPVTNIFYGPLEFEPEKMTIIVGSLVCQFNEIETDYKIEDHITEHDTAIGNLVLEQNRTNNLISNLQTALQEHGDIILGGFHLKLF